MPSPLQAAATPLAIRQHSLKNRLCVAPMTQQKADPDGTPNAAMRLRYEAWARGQFALIFSEGTLTDYPHAGDNPQLPGVALPQHRDAWVPITEAVHAHRCAFLMQLWHQGPRANTPIGPSDTTSQGRRIHGLTTTEIHRQVEHFARSASAAIQAGCDGVEIHGAHGYLIDAFLSPHTNLRSDAYGGDPARRARFAIEVTQAVRHAIGPEPLLSFRFSQWKVDDDSPIKFPSPNELQFLTAALKQAGADLLHVSTRHANEPAFHGSPRTLAGWTRHLSGLPTVCVGSIGLTGNHKDHASVIDPAPALQLINAGQADLCAIGRAALANPDWPRHVLAGQWQNLLPYTRTPLQ